jgi:hypothetical protein
MDPSKHALGWLNICNIGNQRHLDDGETKKYPVLSLRIGLKRRVGGWFEILGA